MTKALVIYHADCNDGFGAALAFWGYAAGQYSEVVYHPGIYGQSFPTPDKDTEVFILDFSYHPETLVEIAGLAKSVTLLDHHKTAQEAWDAYVDEAEDIPYEEKVPPNLHVTFDMNRSGAMMALDYFANDETYDLMFKMLQDRDLWKFEIPGTKSFTRYLNSRPRTFEAWDDLAFMLNSESFCDAVINEGKVRLDEFESICKQIAGQGKRVVYINGTRGLECNVPGLFASDIGNILARESGTFAHTWELLEGRSKHSLRSVGDFDVSAIAKDLGGGGHKNAAGFTIPAGEEGEEVYLKFKQLFSKEPE